MVEWLSGRARKQSLDHRGDTAMDRKDMGDAGAENECVMQTGMQDSTGYPELCRHATQHDLVD